MNRYILPVYEEGPSVVTVYAKNLSNAEDKFIKILSNKWDLDVAADWEDFIDNVYDKGYEIGNILDLEELC